MAISSPLTGTVVVEHHCTSTGSAWRGVARLLILAAVIVAAMFVLHYAATEGLRRITTSSFGVFNRIVDGEINAEIVISGSSRALNHFDPRVIEAQTGASAYNIGVNGSQTDMQVAVFKTYLAHNRPPSLLVASLDSFTFVTSRAGVFLPSQYVPYLNEPDIYQALRRVDPDIWKAKYIPLYGYVAEDMNFTWLAGLARLLGRNPPENRFLGFEPRFAQWSEDFDRFKGTKASGVEFKIEPEGLEQFEDLVRLCKDRGIKVLLVYSPVYFEMQALETNRDTVFTQFKDIATRYDAPLWDYSDSPITRLTSYFVNSEHLNANGASRFSTEFGQALARSRLLRATQ
jgi:hypothetical protein